MRRSILPLAMGLAASAVLNAPAWAGTISASFTDGVLTVTGTGGADDITVGCEGGNVTVNQTDPSGGPVAGTGLHRILVSAGDGPDHASLADVTHSVFGGLGNVSVDGEGGDDTLIGSALGDVLSGGGGSDDLRGGEGADELIPEAGASEVAGGDGRDTLSLRGNTSWTVTNGQVQRSTPYEQTTLGSVETVEIVLGAGDNFVSGASFSGSLVLDGRGGNDLFDTGRGRDLLKGGGGNDRLESGGGADRLLGQGGDDFLFGEAGNDELDGGPGGDGCNGGTGADSLVSC